MADGQRAALVVLTRDDDVRATVTRELDRRYGADYAVVACDRPDAAAAELDRRGLPVAVLIGGLGGSDPDGLEVLRGLHRLHPGAMAVAVVRWGDFDTARPIFEALTMGQLDRWFTVPEVVGDEEFHRAVTEVLDEWTNRQGGGFEAVRMIGRPLVRAGPAPARHLRPQPHPARLLRRRHRRGPGRCWPA